MEFWTDAMDRLFRTMITGPVMKERDGDKKFGYQDQVIRDQVLRAGVADFTVPFGEAPAPVITPANRVLLYCFFNLRVHFYASYVTFRDFAGQLDPIFKKEGGVMVDIGCGPGTAGLALYDLYGTKFEYLGVDRAKAMTDQAAKLLGEFPDVSVATLDSWDHIGDLAGRRVLVNFSYLFASETIADGIPGLAKALKKIAAKAERLVVCMTDSNYNSKCAERFVRLCEEASLKVGVIEKSGVEYYNRDPSTFMSDSPKSVEFVRGWAGVAK